MVGWSCPSQAPVLSPHTNQQQNPPRSSQHDPAPRTQHPATPTNPPSSPSAFSHHCSGSALYLLRSAVGSAALRADGARAAQCQAQLPPETRQWNGVKRGGRAEHPELSPVLQGRASPHQGERSALVLESVLRRETHQDGTARLLQAVPGMDTIRAGLSLLFRQWTLLTNTSEDPQLLPQGVLLLHIPEIPHFPHSRRTGHALPHQLILPSHGAHRSRQAPH